MKCIDTVKWDGLDSRIYLSDNFCTIDFQNRVRSLSSAVLGGGFSEINRAVNLKVQANPEGSPADESRVWDPPEKTIGDFAEGMNWKGPIAGMLTSALMESFRFSIKEEGWGGVYCVLTAGLSNARAAGDPGDFHPEIKGEKLPTGTINLLVGTNASLSDAALAEAIMIATEAKASVLSRYGVTSRLTGSVATGTGTDSILIASGQGPDAAFCGKHTKIGQLIGETVIEALSSSVEYLLER